MKQIKITGNREFCHVRYAILFFCGLFSTVFATGGVDLAGQWGCELDRQGVGLEQKWFGRSLAQTIKLPGTVQEQGLGDPISAQTQWMGRLYDKNWFMRADYKAFTEAGNTRVPFWLQPRSYYRGAAWYQRQIVIPGDWKGRRAVVSFERVQWTSQVWLNDRLIGDNDSLSVAHEYDLGILEPGNYTLTVRVDNRMQQTVREDAHSITDSTQTNWNGLVGNLKLWSTSAVWFKDVKVFSDIEKKTVTLKIQIGNTTGKVGKGQLSAGQVTQAVEWIRNGADVEMTVPLGKDAGLWDEFTPTLHKLKLQLHGDNADDSRDLSIGLRHIEVKDAKFFINNRLTFFRGTHEGCEFPLTGYPPVDVESWRKVLQVCRDYGLNHMRFHSWCPPEAAFVAADELGMYLQPECSNWGQYDRNGKLIEWVNRETQRIIDAYGNHPSFVLFASGNEPAGPWHKILLDWCKEWKAKDNRFVYASQTGRSFEDYSGDVSDIDYLIAIHIGRLRFRGDSGWFGRDFSRALEGTTYPVISHETGQWCAYPDYDEMKKYTGALKPKNYEIFRDSLAANGMLEQAHDFMMASGEFQKACYKEEIEGLLRTPGMGGFQLLDLHDYPGQGTALVGVLNVFWESKGYVTPKEFRRFCDVTVPLARMRQYVYTTADEFNVDVEIAHFGKEPLSKAQPVWKIVDSGNKIVASGQFEAKDIPIGNGIGLGKVTAKLDAFKSPQAYRLVVGLKNTSVENDWDFWVYPAQVKTEAPSGIVVTRSIDEAKKALDDGGSVLFMPPYDQLPWDCPPMGRLPIFWNRLMGPGWDRFLGIVCDPKHPALAGFPTEVYYDWQWQEVIGSACRGINMKGLPKELRPVVQAIDDWNRNYKLGLLFECRVDKGRLMVSAMDIETNLQERPVARQLRVSVLDYMNSKAFDPKVQVTTEQLDSLMFDNRIMKKLGAEIRADQEAGRNGASEVIDGNPNTYWLTADRGREQAHPYELTISFPKPAAMTGLVCMNRQNDREHKGDICEYVIEISDDGQSWKELLKGKLESTFAPQTIEFSKTVTTQYLKLRVLSGFGNDKTSSLAELAVLYAGPKLSDQGDSTQPYQNVRSTTEEMDVESGSGGMGVNQGKTADKPLFRDPVYDGAADPVLCWNRQEKKWFMFYTNRRANVQEARGVSWVHGTPIGIAESSDGGATWKYRGTANIDYKKGDDTYWAPEVIEHEGTYHMYLSYVPGIFNDWNHPRDILHLTSRNLLDWQYQSTLKLSSDRVIDACVFHMPDGSWRMWYNNEPDGKSIYYADSKDLYTWEDKGKAAGNWRGEGPKVFQWKNKYWMIVDVWDGQGVYSSDDAVNWTRQKENLLQKGGLGPDDRTKGLHADVVVSGDRAYIFYFTHPGRIGENEKKDTTEQRRSTIQVAQLEYKDGQLTCDRDKPVSIHLHNKDPR